MLLALRDKLRRVVLARMLTLMESRKPDFVIGDRQLLRWWVIPRNRFFNVYCHYIRKSDDDRALHDHPWINCSWLLNGRYWEVTPTTRYLITRGSLVFRRSVTSHRLEMMPNETAISLFITGPVIRTWGFHCPKGWVPWKDFVGVRDTGQVGRGCGES